MSVLTDNLLLIKYSAGCPAFRAQNKRASAETAERESADSAAVRTWVDLIDPKAIKAVTNCQGRMRTFHYRVTLPWLTNGTSVLAGARFPEYMETYRELHAEFETAAAMLFGAWDDIVADGRRRAGHLADGTRRTLPSRDALARKIYMEIDVLPFPETDFRVQLAEDYAAELANRAAERERAMALQLQRDMWQRLRETVAKLRDQMAPGATFKNTVFRNVRATVAILKDYNLDGDPDLDRISADVLGAIDVLGSDPDVAAQRAREDWARRDRDAVRDRAMEAVNAIERKLSGFAV